MLLARFLVAENSSLLVGGGLSSHRPSLLPTGPWVSLPSSGKDLSALRIPVSNGLLAPTPNMYRVWG